MTAQDAILRACHHDTGNPCELDMGHGEKLNVCANCWNASVYARLEERKKQLAEHWRKYVWEQKKAMDEVGAFVGQRVQYFCRSMLGLGGITITGRIVTNRNGVGVVRMDQIVDGKREAAWNKAWREVQS